MAIKNPTMLKDALHNLDSHSGASVDYCTGLTVGVVSALMAMGYSYKDAIAQVAIHMPAESTKPRYAVPESWQTDLVAARNSITAPFSTK
jgi:hypothetical protein